MRKTETKVYKTRKKLIDAAHLIINVGAGITVKAVEQKAGVCVGLLSRDKLHKQHYQDIREWILAAKRGKQMEPPSAKDFEPAPNCRMSFEDRARLVKQHYREMSARGEKVTRKKLATRVGVTPAYFNSNPRIKQILDELEENFEPMASVSEPGLAVDFGNGYRIVRLPYTIYATDYRIMNVVDCYYELQAFKDGKWKSRGFLCEESYQAMLKKSQAQVAA